MILSCKEPVSARSGLAQEGCEATHMARLVFVPPPLLPSARTRAAQSARARASVVGGMAGGGSWMGVRRKMAWLGGEGP